MSNLVLGIDIGGTKIASGLVDPEAGTLHGFRVVPAGAADGPGPMIERIVALARDVTGAAPAGARVTSVGIGCSGPLDPFRGLVQDPFNLPGWHDVPLPAIVGDALGLPAILENDANAAALGEWRFGAGRGSSDMVYLTISTGVGGGVVSGGRLLRGKGGNAAELGQIVMVPDGRSCPCGGRGCLEAYAAGPALAALTAEAIRAGTPSSLDPDRITGRDVVAGVVAGDPAATAVWDRSMFLLGLGIVTIVHAFDPALVVIGGGVANAGALLFDPVRRILAERGTPHLVRGVDIVPAALGAQVGVFGAAAAALDRLAGGLDRLANPGEA